MILYECESERERQQENQNAKNLFNVYVQLMLILS